MKETKDCFIGLFSEDTRWLADLGFILQKDKFKTVGVNDLTQARSLNRLTRPDLIVTDDPQATQALIGENIPTLCIPPDLQKRKVRDEIIKKLFPASQAHKRFHERVPVNYEAFLEMPLLEGQFLNGTILNISRRGVFVSPKELLPEKNDVVRLEFLAFNPGPFTFEALGIVRWTRYSSSLEGMEGFGIEFVSVSDVSGDYLSRFSETQPKAP